MKKGLLRFFKKTRIFLADSKSKEFLVFLFFLALSAGFWLMLTLDETFEVSVPVPLHLTNVPEKTLIATELPSEVHATIRDKGSSIFRFFRHNELKPVELDFTKYDNGLVSSRVYVPNSDILHAVQGQLDVSSRVLGIQPDTLSFFYNRGHKAYLPVRIVGQISAAQQNYLTKVECAPDSVWVFAPRSVLDTLQAAYTQEVDMKDLQEETSRDVNFVRMRDVKYIPEAVHIAASVDYYTDKTIEVPIVGLNFPADKRLKTFPSRVKVTFRVGAARFRYFNEDNFVLAPTYEELLSNQSERYTLHLRSIPEGVSHVRIYPSEVEYLIEKIDNSEDAE